jgi:hypothetical protein
MVRPRKAAALGEPIAKGRKSDRRLTDFTCYGLAAIRDQVQSTGTIFISNRLGLGGQVEIVVAAVALWLQTDRRARCSSDQQGP